MIRTNRYLLSTTPISVGSSHDDNQLGREVTVITQGPGTLVVCEGVDSYVTGARIPVANGTVVNFTESDPVWLASPDSLAVDVIESGVL